MQAQGKGTTKKQHTKKSARRKKPETRVKDDYVKKGKKQVKGNEKSQ